MKKVFIFAVVVGGLVFTACKKDHVCSCDITALGITTSFDTTYTDMKKADAETACEANNIEVVGLASVACALK